VVPAFDPFATNGPDEVPLERAPLVRVIAQLRFPPIVSLNNSDFIGPFQEEIRPRYPILRKEQTTGLLIGPPGIVAQRNDGAVWRFHDKTDSWRVSLAADFLALESMLYKDRDDFFDRFSDILTALEKLTNMAVYDRLGVRYINRVHGPELERLPTLVRPEVIGLGASAVPGLNHTLTESVFTKGDIALNTRWGRLPSNATTDAASINPIEGPSWILDLDMFRGVQKDFDTSSIIDDARMFARTIHDFFRWCVTPEFLAAYGGKQ
jgi:uncharacterized protein (TIGR04255 family)